MKHLWVLIALASVACGDAASQKVAANNGSSNNTNNTNNTNNANTNNATNNANNVSACPVAAAGTDLAVATKHGDVVGQAQDGVASWLGVPFALPPVGERRFAPPQTDFCFAEPIAASAYGSICAQVQDGTFSGSEDCLTLNVWAPEDADNLPVLVFIHGGGNAVGSSSQTNNGVPLFDGSSLARNTQSVVVTMNYRLGQLGFLVHPALDGDVPSGNLGLRDQIAALEFVQDNITNFGGDPSRVLLFGESAGGLNTCLLWASTKTSGLFSAAITQSGGCSAPSRDEQIAVADDFVTTVGCNDDTLNCLRGLDVEALMLTNPTVVEVAGRSTGYAPYVDGDILEDTPLGLVRSNQHTGVPIMFGANSDETSRSAPPLATEQAYQTAVRTLFPGIADQILAQYPAANYATPRRAFVQLTSDAKFICPQRIYASAASEVQSNVFRYMFTQRLENSPQLRPFGAFHGLELAFVFGTFDEVGYQPSDAEAALSAAMQAYWRSMVDETFAPAGLPALVDYDARDPYLLLEAGEILIDEGWDTDNCDFWEPLLAVGLN